MLPLLLDSAIAQLRQLRQSIHAQSLTLRDLVADAFTIGHRGQLAAAIESDAPRPRDEVAAELREIVQDLESTLPELEEGLEYLRRCSSLHESMAAELSQQERRAFKDLAERLREQTGE
jgi:exonuclease VII small subunit